MQLVDAVLGEMTSPLPVMHMEPKLNYTFQIYVTAAEVFSTLTRGR